MPQTQIKIFQEKEGDVPLIEWLDQQSVKVQDAMISRIELLAEKGSELRRPVCDMLRDGILRTPKRTPKC